MKDQNKSIITGFVLFILAALFSASILGAFFNFGANESIFIQAGKIILGVYGFSSIIIPVFLIVAGVQSFVSSWSRKNGIILLGSVIPFITIALAERIIRSVILPSDDVFMIPKLSLSIVCSILLIIIEFLVLCVLGNAFDSDTSQKIPKALSDREMIDDEDKTICEATFDASFFEDNDESNNENNDNDSDQDFESNSSRSKAKAHAEKKSDAGMKNSISKSSAILSDSVSSVEPVESEISDSSAAAKGDIVQEFEEPEEVADDEDANAETEIVIDESNPFFHVFDKKEEEKEDDDFSLEEEEREVPHYRETESINIEEEASFVEPVPLSENFAEAPEEEARREEFVEPEPEYIEDEELNFEEPEAPAEEAFGSHEAVKETLASRAAQELIEEQKKSPLDPDFYAIDLSEPSEKDEDDSYSDEPELLENADDANDADYIGDEDEAAELDEDFQEEEMRTIQGISEETEVYKQKISEENAPDVFPADDDIFAEESYDDENEEPLSQNKDYQEVSRLSTEDLFKLADSDNEDSEDSLDEIEEVDEIENAEPVLEAEEPEEIEEADEEPALKEEIDTIFAEMDDDAATEPMLVDEEPENDEIDSEDKFDSVDEVFDEDSFDIEENDASEVESPDFSGPASSEPKPEATTEELEDFFGDENDSDEIEADESDNEDEFDLDDEEDLDGEIEAMEELLDEEEAEKEAQKAAAASNAQNAPAIQAEKEAPAAPKRPKKNIPYSIPTDILVEYPDSGYKIIDEQTRLEAEELEQTLSEFKIEAEVTGIRKGPVVTMFELLPAPGVKLSKIVALQDNIALRLAAKSVRIVAPIPGKHAVGIEVPNRERAIVGFREIIEQERPEWKKMAVPVILGKDISGEGQIIDIAKTPHLLIAGSTGSGKSVCVNSLILSILYKRSPSQVKMILIDPKIVELKLYNDIPHLLTPVITEPKRAMQALQYCLCEMERRYAMLDGMGVRDITSYNNRIKERNICQETLPYIVVIIDEFADLMATTGKELESTVARLAAMSRAVGIHLVLATQRPSVDVITGLIKANIPSRIAFMVAARMDSRIIIDQVGAEKLLGKGDMLYTSATDPFPVRIQGTLISDDEVESVVDCVKGFGSPDYIDDEIFVDDDEEDESNPSLFGEGEDPLYDQALQIVVQAGKASASYIQRRLKIGYNRAARLVEEMEARGIVGPANGSKPREIVHMP